MNNSESIKIEESKFHWLTLPGHRATSELYDTIIEETQNFVVLPTKGSIVAGWVLIVPKFPVSRIADVPQHMRSELNDLVWRVFTKLESEFGASYSFEHGGRKGSQISCGVDQAHLHVAALNFDLIAAAQSESPDGWLNVKADLLPDSSMDTKEYWFASSRSATVSKVISQPTSQFFRKIIARNSGKADFWDYRSENFAENIALTIKTMSANG